MKDLVGLGPRDLVGDLLGDFAGERDLREGVVGGKGGSGARSEDGRVGRLGVDRGAVVRARVFMAGAWDDSPLDTRYGFYTSTIPVSPLRLFSCLAGSDSCRPSVAPHTVNAPVMLVLPPRLRA